MNKLTWLDLYNFLYEQANSTNNIGKFNWQEPVTIYNAETGEEFDCDTYNISNSDNDSFVLAINVDSIYNN